MVIFERDLTEVERLTTRMLGKSRGSREGGEDKEIGSGGHPRVRILPIWSKH